MDLKLPGKRMIVEADPLTRFSEAQLDEALDAALDQNDSRVIWAVVAELERRGQILEV